MRTKIAVAGTTTVVLCAGAAALTVPAQAADNPYERGPAPTLASVEAARGSYAVSQTSVGAQSGRFGGGTIYYPTSTADGTFGAIVLTPGFLSWQSSLSWLGPRLASQGFVVFTIDTLGISDFPGARADQMLAAADYLTGQSTVRTRVDATRIAVGGWSMGGGGTMEAARDRPSLKAAIPLSPWTLFNTNFSGVRVPTLIVGAEGDIVASPGAHSEPIYQSVGQAEKAYLELEGGGHFTVTSPNTTMARTMISWLKRFVDDDTRYTQFLCPGPGVGFAVSEFRNTCPM